jgi:hypothetical protein
MRICLVYLSGRQAVEGIQNDVDDAGSSAGHASGAGFIDLDMFDRDRGHPVIVPATVWPQCRRSAFFKIGSGKAHAW